MNISCSDVKNKNTKDIKLNNFDISIGSKQLLKNTELTIVYGRKYGLIGPNGSGKTTLLNAINNRELPINDADIYLVEQEVYSSDETVINTVIKSDIKLNKLKNKLELLESKVNCDNPSDKDLNEYNSLNEEIRIYDIDSKKPQAQKILYGLGFSKEKQDVSTKQFSGGWRMRISLAKALFMKPTILLLDEPTNHLDLNAVIWLNDYLEDWKKTLIIVSHDVDFLDNICSDIIHLHNKKLMQYKGNYENFKKMETQIKEKELKDWEKHQKKIKEEKKSNKKDKEKKIDINSKKNDKKKNRNIEESSSDVLEKEKEILKKPKDYIVSFSFPKTNEISPPILEVKGVSFCYNKDNYIFKNLDFGINMDDRICIVGNNGVGKTTLLNMLIGELLPTSGEVICNRHLRIGKFNQHFVDKLPVTKSAVEYLLEIFPTEKEQNIRSMLGKYGLQGNSHLIKMGDLSGGQKARVQLLMVSLNKPHLIFMDEPTNHLDMESIDALVKAINNFNGGIVIISHDIRLIENTNCQLWVCDRLNCKKFKGSIDDYKDNVINNIDSFTEISNKKQSNSIFDLL